ncbi:hypothetical protein [Roseiflexus sp.]
MEAPAGLAYPPPFPMPGGAGLIQPAGLARPQPGLQPAEAHDDGTLQPGKGQRI